MSVSTTEKSQKDMLIGRTRQKLKVTYSPLSGKCKMGSCLPFTASCSAVRSSFYRWPRSGRLRLAGRLRLVGKLKFDRTFRD